jgi:hypothetical protein
VCVVHSSMMPHSQRPVKPLICLDKRP